MKVKSMLSFKGRLSKYLSDKSLKQLKRYIIVGFSSFAFEYCLFALFYKIIFNFYYKEGFTFAQNTALKLINIDLKLDTFRYIIANTIVYILVFWFNFLLNRFWSFEAKGNLKRQLLLYGILFIFNLIVINFLMYLFSDIFGITPLISKVFTMGFVVCWNFVIYKKLIYK